MTGTDFSNRPTWVIDVSKQQRDASAHLVELAVSQAERQNVNLLLVHVLTEVPTSRELKGRLFSL